MAERSSTEPEPDCGYFLSWGERIKGEGGRKSHFIPSAARSETFQTQKCKGAKKNPSRLFF
jgi:hypothetical protein